MTKFSCKIGDFKSSVVTLKDGRVMEVRRGNKTTFYGADPRTYWPSLDDWKATLPEGGVAIITQDGPATPVDRYATTNPVLARFFERVRAKHGGRVKSRNITSRGTHEEQARRNLAYYRSNLARYKASSTPVHDASNIIFYEKYTAEAEATLAKVVASDKSTEKIYSVKKSCFFTMLPDSNLVSIHYIAADNMIAYRGKLLDGYLMWIPLTDPEMPLWLQYGDNDMIKV
jgi:hypothetical protein